MLCCVILKANVIPFTTKNWHTYEVAAEMLALRPIVVCLHLQAVYKMSVAASLSKPNPLTAEECTNRIFVRLDKDNNGEEIILTLRQCSVNSVRVLTHPWVKEAKILIIFSSSAIELHSLF